jgi:hypothetical protein
MTWLIVIQTIENVNYTQSQDMTEFKRKLEKQLLDAQGLHC